MHRRILFKLGVSIVVSVAIVLFYLVNLPEERSRSGGRAYRKLVLGSSPDFVSSHLSHELRQKGDHEFLNKHVEAMRIHTQVSASKSGMEANSSHQVLEPPAKADHEELEDKLSLPALKLKKEPIHLLGDFGQDTVEEAKNTTGNKKNRKQAELISSRKIDHSVLNNSGKEHDFRFEREHIDANIKRLREISGHGSPPIHLCVVVCGSRSQETLTMLKSASMVTPLNVSFVFHIFAEPENQKFFQDQLDLWPLVQRQRLSYHIYNVTFPDSSTTNAWKKLFKPCASQRLFLPNLLRSVKRLIYVDTDTVFLESLAHLWSMFSDFNSTQLAGLVGEAEAGFAAWYNRFASHPFYGKFGLNSGVMLMDLERLRQTSWLRDMQRLFNEYRLSLPWGDQDLINIYFAFHPDQMYLMPCKWNYRNDHCRYTSNCVSAEQSGVSVLHGSRRTFEEGKEPLLKIIHKAFMKYALGDDMEFQFLKKLEEDIGAVKHKVSNCWKVSDIFLTQLQFLKERNREFMQASRKESQRLASARRQSRAKNGQRESNTNTQKQPLDHQTVNTRNQVKEKVPLQEEKVKNDAPPRQQKQKLYEPKGRMKEEPAQLPTDQKESEGEHKEGIGSSIKKTLEESRNISKPREERKSAAKHRDGDKRVPNHHITLMEDTLEEPKPDVLKMVRGDKGQGQIKEDIVQGQVRDDKGQGQVKAAEGADGKLKLDSHTRKTPVGKESEGLKDAHTGDVHIMAGKSASGAMHLDREGQGHQDENSDKVLRKGSPKIEQEVIDYDATEDKDNKLNAAEKAERFEDDGESKKSGLQVKYVEHV